MFYRFTDFSIPILIAGLASVLSSSFIDLGWNMLFAMGVGMLCGMIAQIPVALILMPLLGAFEVMLPAMLAGMLSGMITGMIASNNVLSLSESFLFGSLVGVSVAFWVKIKNNQLQGEVK